MEEEILALKENQTWDLVAKPKDVKPISCKWVYKIKTQLDGSIERYKARLVARGFSSHSSMDWIMMKHSVLWQRLQPCSLFLTKKMRPHRGGKEERTRQLSGRHRMQARTKRIVNLNTLPPLRVIGKRSTFLYERSKSLKRYDARWSAPPSLVLLAGFRRSE
ncbi:hypothetical protein GH714_043958 [Hevea brasiliensis]|uniref:Reverse transcriptase Ty1/copia-type domain-containing protein n=1 Tax=Hevea brasiliensis TaxID=3981 RepID=A0A6A6K090_HEVBR|nr:hypothetical protein GH714_043958 [Hevea brasiliensis]